MKYNLNELSAQQQNTSSLRALQKLLLLITEERRILLLALLAIITNSALNLLGPFIIGHVIDTYIVTKNYDGVLRWAGILLGMYLVAFVASYLQTRLMGGVGQRMLFKLRNTVFNKLLELPVAFFNQNKTGDLISRVNNDTDKINQFFSQSLMQFIGTLVTMTGAGIFLLSINTRLGIATLVPGLLIFLITKLTSAWVKITNSKSMQTTGGLSAEIQEGLQNFKVIIAFNRRDYFRQRFETANEHNYKTAIAAGIANNSLLPVYGFCAAMAQLVVLGIGIYMISRNEFSFGLLVSYLAYAVNFYNPLRQLAILWASFQVAMAGWDRIFCMITIESDLPVLADNASDNSDAVIELKDVSFSYDESREILHHVSLRLLPGKTYALVGPTGGGKTTTASLLARLYDPSKGQVLLHGRDIRSFAPAERTQKIGFILQEPFLFTGTVKDNILYGNEAYAGYSSEALHQVIEEAGLQRIIDLFDQGLDTSTDAGADSMSLGQKQLIAFMRAVLRNPDLLILDEATANIDTITEQVLQDILNRLPSSCTRVIIAHRLNTIQNADEIYFVNAGEVVPAGSFEHAVDMLLHGDRRS
ncbi:ABC transporter ATP-binding protein [soil metagenome]